MKQQLTILVIGILLAYSNAAGAQTMPDIALIKLEKVSDFKNAEPFALQTANYLLITGFQKDNSNRVKSLEFLFKWMSGTPDYSFNFEYARNTVSKGNTDVLGIYMAAMVKYTLENKDSAKDANLVKLNAVKILLNYCENKNNNIKMTKQLKIFAEAKAKGELEKAL